MPLVLDVSEIATTEALHGLLESSLGFPGYYGRNWDAFWDCITDPEQSTMPDVLLVTGWDRLANKLPRDAALMRECLADMPSRRSDCRVEWVPNSPQEPASRDQHIRES
jgi:RNAse (barnase) inhibitor barstar